MRVQAGVLAGGLTDGSICLWNPAKVLRAAAGSTDEGAGAAVATLRKHTGPVKGLEFNASSPNLLASGSTDGDLVIWDVAQPSAPASYQLVRCAVPDSWPAALTLPSDSSCVCSVPSHAPTSLSATPMRADLAKSGKLVPLRAAWPG